MERNTLMERVYPRIKSYCQERGYDFQVVDMRWGVRDESTDDHMTTELCMRELRACQKLSTGPNFIVSWCNCSKRNPSARNCFNMPCHSLPDVSWTKVWISPFSSENHRFRIRKIACSSWQWGRSSNAQKVVLAGWQRRSRSVPLAANHVTSALLSWLRERRVT